MRYLRRSIQKTVEDVGGPQETRGAVNPEYPPPMSEARWPWLELAIITTVYALQIVIWCLSGDALMMALRWFAERVGITMKAVLWILSGAASGIGWTLYLLWPKLEAVCSYYGGVACH